ncbi:hypothetical protein [Nocardioides daphniae]|uniref:hypothetical protein n=1 Tax=Nocardioides daphniae TaxID=402297 RepID=UPI001477766D|nr:hypothetical protein [Nocardioides daphniae]
MLAEPPATALVVRPRKASTVSVNLSFTAATMPVSVVVGGLAAAIARPVRTNRQPKRMAAHE